MSQFERIACIDRLLRERGCLKTAEVVERFEVSARQVKRDISLPHARGGVSVESISLILLAINLLGHQ